MTPQLRIDTRRLHDSIKMLHSITRVKMKDLMTQAALDVVGKTFDSLPPFSRQQAEAIKERNRAYMTEQMSQRVKYIDPIYHAQPLDIVDRDTGEVIHKARKVKAIKRRFAKLGRNNQQLMRKHLIAQMVAKKSGLKGLYGKKMTAMAARLQRKSNTTIGSLKIPLVNIIRGLNPYAEFKFPFEKTAWIKRWPGGIGGREHATLVMRKAADNPGVAFSVDYEIRSGEAAKVFPWVVHALQDAMRWKADKLQRAVARELLDVAGERQGPRLPDMA